MKHSFYWYLLESDIPNAFERIRDAFVSQPYDSDTRKGFSIELATADEVDGTYVVRSDYIETVPSPFGEPIEVPRTVFQTLRFRMRRSKPQILLQGYSRLRREFFNVLQSSLPKYPIVTPVVVSPLVFIKEIESRVKKTEVVALKTKVFPLNSRTIVRVQFSGITTLLSDATEFLKGQSKGFSYVKARISTDGAVEAVELFDSGRVCLTCERNEQTFRLVEQAVAAVVAAGA